MLDRSIDLAAIEKELSDIKLSDLIIWRSGGGVAPQSFGIFPMNSLSSCAPSEKRHNNRTACKAQRSLLREKHQKISGRPSECDDQANLGQIRITISVALQTDLENSDHGQYRN